MLAWGFDALKVVIQKHPWEKKVQVPNESSEGGRNNPWFLSTDLVMCSVMTALHALLILSTTL